MNRNFYNSLVSFRLGGSGNNNCAATLAPMPCKIFSSIYLQLLNLDVFVKGFLIVIVNGLNSTTDDPLGSWNDNVLDSPDVAAVREPVESDVSQDVDETGKWYHHRDSGIDGIGNSTLDRREDSTTSNTHNQDTSTAAGMVPEVGSTKSKEGWVHRGLEEVEKDHNDDTRLILVDADGSIKNNSADSVDDEEEISLEDPTESKCQKATDSEGDKGI